MTLKAFRECVRLGARMTVLDHWRKELVGTCRTVVKVQTNGFFFRTDGAAKRSWSPYPKASELKFDGVTAQIEKAFDPAQHEAPMHWTVRIEPAGASEAQIS